MDRTTGEECLEGVFMGGRGHGEGSISLRFAYYVRLTHNNVTEDAEIIRGHSVRPRCCILIGTDNKRKGIP